MTATGNKRWYVVHAYSGFEKSVARALEDRSSLSAHALSIFIRCYGSFAGDMGLAFLAHGGVYICGGIAAKLASRFAEGDFVEAFNHKGRHRDIAASIPVRLVTNESLGLAGAALAAMEEAAG